MLKIFSIFFWSVMGVRGTRGGWELFIWVPKYLPMINPVPDPDWHQDVHPEHLADLSDKVEQKFKKYPNSWQLPVILGVMKLTYPAKVRTDTRMSTIWKIILIR